MALLLRKGPEQGRSLVGRAFSDLNGPADANARLGGATVDLSDPLPVYRLTLDRITGRDCLARAEHVGWRYLIESGGKAAFADVQQHADGPVRFASLSQNAHADRLIEAAQLGQAATADAAEDYEPRILDVPSLHISALWLLGGRSLFIPVIDMKRLKGADVEVEDGFLDDLVRRAERKRAVDDEASARAKAGG